MQLRDLQKKFLISFKNNEISEYVNCIDKNKNLTQSEQFNIYKNSITAGLLRALRETYSVICKLVGEEYFNWLGRQYIQQTPSISPNLNDFGKKFSDFLAACSATHTLPYLADIAKLEWSYMQVYYGKNYIALDINMLQKIHPEDHTALLFKRCENSVLLTSYFPIKKIWQVNQFNYNGDQTVILDYTPIYLLVWRPRQDVIIEEISHIQWTILNLFEQNITLGEIAEHEISKKIDLNAEILKIFNNGWLSSAILK